jgi:hypothetical protein
MSILFIPIDNSPDLCPKCGREEDTVVVCRNCGHEYECESSFNYYLKVCLSIVAVLIILWLCVTIMCWLAPLDSPTTLVGVLKSQWEYIKQLRIW